MSNSEKLNEVLDEIVNQKLFTAEGIEKISDLKKHAKHMEEENEKILGEKRKFLNALMDVNKIYQNNKIFLTPSFARYQNSKIE